MTYQQAFAANDGMVIASDRREYLLPGTGDEGEGPKINSLTKIMVDPTGQFAWAYAGGEISPFAAANLKTELQKKLPATDSEIEQLLVDTGNASWQAARGPNNGSTILLLDGKTKTIWRAKLSPNTVVEKLKDGQAAAGQSFNKASLFPQRFYSAQMNVDALSLLAAYTIESAHKMDPVAIEGLDIAVYRDATGRFEFLDADLYRRKAQALHEDFRKLFSESST